MTEKLTAKLSDGTEWEVDKRYDTGSPDVRSVYLTRIKPEPPREIWVNYYPDGKFGDTYLSPDKAKASARPDGKAYRYILAPEPEKKPREWWAVQWQRPLGSIAPNGWQFECQADAALWAAKALPDSPFKIRRVREVEE